MRLLITLLFVLMSLFSSVAMADDTEGKITSINEEDDTIVLEDGKVYKLPGEFDYSAINQGMKISISYDVVGQERFITNIEEAE
ncbi:DUF1344 domain-containing protein [Phyllobacterium salinisoli]|uniref:DUF1344 domain-containing protein n=1 Tax=Phyllobacterium salinisoli TaxID=1899321 RepID=A0A368K431_9HYPH|nr:DUF1344 domain-containing protein [Phyllobacterium salinisoli]RCS23395.1 DUF1344 domain-containing protein [Phyllobacterium salinisoli]